MIIKPNTLALRADTLRVIFNQCFPRYSLSLNARFIAALCFSMLIVLAAGCKKKPALPPPPEVQVITLAPTNVPIFEEWIGTLDGFVNAQIHAQVTGYLLTQNYAEGSEVKKGDLLFQIDPRPFQAELDQALAKLAQDKAQAGKTELDVKRYTPLAQEPVSYTHLGMKMGKNAVVGTQHCGMTHHAHVGLEVGGLSNLVPHLELQAGVFVMEYTFPNLQHAAIFYQVCAVTFPFRLISLGLAGRTSWPVTRVAAVYLLIECLMIWILPLFPAQPRLAPIFNPVTHMVPPPFPLLLILPAVVIDLILRHAGEATGWRRVALALVLGAIFLAVFVPVQWFFAKFLISPHANNWFFAGDRVWSYGNRLGDWTTQFWRVNPSSSDANLLTLPAMSLAWVLAAVTSWLGLLLGGWMRKIQR